MSDINLLPHASGPSKSVLRLSKNLKKFLTFSSVLVIGAGVVMLGAFVFFSQEANTKDEEQKDLIASIRSLEETEQKLILVKDRLHKIQKVYSKSANEKGVEELDTILGFLPDGVLVKEAKIIGNTVEIKMSAQNTDQVSNVLSSLTASSYTTVELTSLNYSTLRGLNMSVKVIL